MCRLRSLKSAVDDSVANTQNQQWMGNTRKVNLDRFRWQRVAIPAFLDIPIPMVKMTGKKSCPKTCAKFNMPAYKCSPSSFQAVPGD